MTPAETQELARLAADMRTFLLRVGTAVIIAVIIAAVTNLATMLYWKGGLDEWRGMITTAVEGNTAAIRDLERTGR